MKGWKWIAAAANGVLGFLFPYALVGCIVLIYGFMTPPTAQQRITGMLIAVLYLLVTGAVNYFGLRGSSPGKERRLHLLVYALAWLFGTTVSFALI